MTTPTSKGWQDSGEEFHMMMGQCIAMWAQVDDELFRIFRDCVGPYEQCAIIYYRTPGLDTRFSLTDEIVLSVLPKPDRKSGGHDKPAVTAWKSAKKGYGDLLGVRRRIAHQPATIRLGPTNFALNNRTLNEPPPSWFEIYVNQHEQLREKECGKAPLRIKDLQDHLLATITLRDRLNRFFHEILTKQPKAYAQPTPPPESLKSPS
jgi:hypothetical protein